MKEKKAKKMIGFISLKDVIHAKYVRSCGASYWTFTDFSGIKNRREIQNIETTTKVKKLKQNLKAGWTMKKNL